VGVEWGWGFGGVWGSGTRNLANPFRTSVLIRQSSPTSVLIRQSSPQPTNVRRPPTKSDDRPTANDPATRSQWIPTIPAQTQFEAPAPPFQIRDAIASCSDFGAR
jgi:hypothetical protein